MAKAPLTQEERRVIKALLQKGEKSQEILSLVNTNRSSSVNGGRISGVKKDPAQELATDDEIAMFRLRKTSFDPKTGLNQFADERLVRAREAMILAVQVFNSGSLKFKTEVFTVLTNIAWTYLLHEHYVRNGVELIDDRGKSLVLSQMLDRADCPLSKSIIDNLKAIKILRDAVEHLLLGVADTRWFSLFQASCLNFDKFICERFGPSMTLANDLSFALQFAKPDIIHLSSLMNFQIPPEIEAVDARLVEGLTDEDLNNLEYRFKVIYTLDSSQRNQANFQFVSPGSDEGVDIHNVLAKKVPADEIYPFKAKPVVDAVRNRTGQDFNSRHHTKAWKLFRVRPCSGAQQPGQTDKRYCIYHAAHRDYTYSHEWIERLVAEVSDPIKFDQIKLAPA